MNIFSLKFSVVLFLFVFEHVNLKYFLYNISADTVDGSFIKNDNIERNNLISPSFRAGNGGSEKQHSGKRGERSKSNEPCEKGEPSKKESTTAGSSDDGPGPSKKPKLECDPNTGSSGGKKGNLTVLLK